MNADPPLPPPPESPALSPEASDVDDFRRVILPPGPTERLGMGCGLALLIPAALVLGLMLLGTLGEALMELSDGDWYAPACFCPLIMAPVMWGVVFAIGKLVSRISETRPRFEGCVVEPTCVRLFHAGQPFTIALGDIRACGAVEYYLFWVRLKTFRPMPSVSPLPRFEHPQFGRGVLVWKRRTPSGDDQSEILLLELAGNERIAFDVAEAGRVAEAIKRRRLKLTTPSPPPPEV